MRRNGATVLCLVWPLAAGLCWPLPADDATAAGGWGVPGTVRQPGQIVDWRLSLAEARHMALANNKDIAYVRYLPIETEALVASQHAIFDPIFEFGGTWRKLDRQVANEVESIGLPVDAVVNEKFDPGQTMPDTIALIKPLQTGGSFRISQGAVYDRISPAGSSVLVNPAWRSSTNFILEQPLLRNRGLKVNRLGLCIAQANRRQSIHAFRTTVQGQLRDVELAYWELYYACQDLASRQKAVEYARATWDKEEQKLRLGEGSIPDVAQAREQYEKFRIECNTADNGVFGAEGQLRRVLGIPGWDGRRVVVEDQPLRVELPTDWHSAVAEALGSRPELRARREAVRAAEMEVSRVRNELLPDVAFVGRYSMTGLDDRYDQSLNRLTEGDHGEWTLGFVYQQTIGRRPAGAAVRRVEAILGRQRGLLHKAEHDMLHELQAAYQELAAAGRALDLYQARLEAAAVQLNAREELYRLGETSVDLFLRAQATYTEAQREDALGVVRYNQAIAQWEYAKGSILARGDVVLAGETPAPRSERSTGRIP